MNPLISALFLGFFAVGTMAIVGGNGNVNSDTYGYIVRIDVDNNYTCVGVALNDSYVLTAASCFNGIAVNRVRTCFYPGSGVMPKTSTANCANPTSIITSSLYNSANGDDPNNFAILEFAANALAGIAYREIGTTQQVKSFRDSTGGVQVFGWANDDNLRRLSTSTVDDGTCDNDGAFLLSNQVCFGNPGSTAACAGDLGSPVIRNNRVVGVFAIELTGEVDICGTGYSIANSLNFGNQDYFFDQCGVSCVASQPEELQSESAFIPSDVSSASALSPFYM